MQATETCRDRGMPTTSTLPISAFIISKNEMDMIGPCIESLNACKEIIIVDSGSTDGTIERIREYKDKGYPIRLLQREWPGYAAQKQFALDQCSEIWCLNLDCDERLDPLLQQELATLTSRSQNCAAWRLGFSLFLYGYGYTPDRVRFGTAIRLMRRDRARYGLGELVHEGVEVDGEIGTVNKGKILHARVVSLGEQILKENHYSTLKAEQLFKLGKRPRLLRLIFNPIIYFQRLYIFRRFFLCGWAGFIYAWTGAIYSFMTEAKLYQLHARMRRDPSQS